MIDHYLDCGYILGQYMNNKHNLLYKTWADRPKKMMMVKKKKKKVKKERRKN